MTGALNGLRVLDLSRILAGPFATQNLADLGADVVKVEAPWGDDTRSWGPPFIGAEGHQSAAYFHSCNRGKRSISIDMKTEDGHTLLKKLIGQADIVVENMKVGTLTRIGLDPNILIRENPKLIICQITGFGQTGPRSMQPGYDVALQGMSGIMSVTGEVDGPPVKVGVAWIDVLTGFAATSAILAALHHRDKTGEGQIIDLSLFDVALMSMVNQAQNWIASGDIPRPMGHAHPNIVPYQAFQAKDGWIIIAVGSDPQFEKLCRALNMENNWKTNSERVSNRKEIAHIISEKTSEYNRIDLTELLQGIPTSPINKISEALNDPQSIARGVVTSWSNLPVLASPLRFMSKRKK